MIEIYCEICFAVSQTQVEDELPMALLDHAVTYPSNTYISHFCTFDHSSCLTFVARQKIAFKNGERKNDRNK